MLDAGAPELGVHRHVDELAVQPLEVVAQAALAQELLGEGELLVDVALQSRQEETLLAAECGVQAALRKPGSLDQPLRSGGPVALLPEQVHRLLHHLVLVELAPSGHADLPTRLYALWTWESRIFWASGFRIRIAGVRSKISPG